MSYRKIKNFYILKIEKNEEIQQTIKKFCKKTAKNGGFFIGIGAVNEAILAHYSIKNKKYIQKKINKPLELVSLIGNVCFSGEKIIIHSHATLADRNLKTFSGHLLQARISGTCEIIFFPFSKKIQRIFDKMTGLKLMKL